ncbi:MAG: hypothetical protein NTX14_00475 [Candidatus Nealsonbacteria bacterium]|nr:hypothetical protein [Candidatus Nealsonbacteria bacterium]
MSENIIGVEQHTTIFEVVIALIVAERRNVGGGGIAGEILELLQQKICMALFLAKEDEKKVNITFDLNEPDEVCLWLEFKKIIGFAAKEFTAMERAAEFVDKNSCRNRG